MEDITCGLSALEIDQKEKQFHQFWHNVYAFNHPGTVMEEWKPTTVADEEIDKINTENEISLRDRYEAQVSEADLATVQVRYIPEYIRELKTKEEYWKKEFKYWGDLISKKNWKLYEKRVKDEIIRNKTVLKNFNNYSANVNPKDPTHFSQSLDPERVQRIVDYIKEKESDDEMFDYWLRASVYTHNLRNLDYIQYAVFARYGDFRARPSRLNLKRAAEEKTKDLPQN